MPSDFTLGTILGFGGSAWGFQEELFPREKEVIEEPKYIDDIKDPCDRREMNIPS
jgi:hypothetical protein